jgi:hypothetical protein
LPKPAVDFYRGAKEKFRYSNVINATAETTWRWRSAESASCGLQFHKRRQLFIRTHDEPFSLAVGVNDPNCAPIIVKG